MPKAKRKPAKKLPTKSRPKPRARVKKKATRISPVKTPAKARRQDKSESKPFLLVQLTDTHLLEQTDALQSGWNTQASFAAVLDDIRAQPLDALIATGDLVHDGSALAYSRMASTLHKLQVPVLYLPGNHDDPQRLHTAFAPLGESAPARVVLGGWQLLLLDDHLPGDDAGLLSQDQMDQLAYWLVHHPEPALIAVHHPPVPVGSRWLDEKGLRNGLALLKLAALYPQVRAICCGHIHQALDMTIHGIRVLASPSTCRQFTTNSRYFSEDSDALPGYRCIWLYPDGRFSTEVRRVAAAHLSRFQL